MVDQSQVSAAEIHVEVVVGATGRVLGHGDTIAGLGQSAYLVELDQNRIGNAFFNPLAQDTRVGHEQVVSHQLHPIADDIQRVTREQPDLTLSELKAELGTELSEATLCRALQALKLTLKKKS